MQRYGRPEIVRFLREFDDLLDAPTKLVLVGGAAAILQYGSEILTKDIDAISAVPANLAKMLAQIEKRTGHHVPMEKVGTYDAPYHMVDRYENLNVKFKKLKVLVPERHDLFLMKTARGDARDYQVLESIHRKHPFDLDVLIRRFDQEAGHMTTSPHMRVQLRNFIRKMFGEQGAQKFDAKRTVEGDYRV